MKSKLFTFLFIALAGLSFGLPPSAKEIEQYTSASFMYMDIKDYKSALVMARKAVAISSGTPLTFVMANARAVLGVAYMKDNPIATPGIENNIEQAIRYYQSIGKKNDLDKFIIKNLELVLENALTESPTEELIKIPNLLIDSLMVRRFSDPYFDIQNGFKLEHNSELVYVAKKMAFASQLSRNTLILPQDLSDQLGEKALRISKNLQDRELIARTTANVGAVYSKDSRNILTSTFQLNDAIETFDDLQISTPEIAPIEQLLQPQAKSNTLFKKQLGARTYASIEIGSGGVKLAILQYRRNQSKEIIFDVVEKPKSEDTKFTDFVEPNLRQTIRKVVEYHKYVSDPNGTHALSPRQIFITVSSGVIRSIGNDLKRLEMLTALREGIIRESGHPEVAILEEADEPKLTLLGVLPEESRQNKNDELYRHVLIDIGTGNTKGGYFGRDKDQKLFSYFTSSWGLRRLEEKLKSFPIEQVEKAAAQLVDSVMRNEIIGMLGASSIQNKSDVILNGGIFWAVTAFTKPERYFDITDPQFIQITVDDIVNFRRMVRDEFDSMVKNPKIYLSKIDPKQTDSALITLDDILKIGYIRLLAGAIFAEAIIRHNNNSPVKKTYRFAKYGHIGWPAGWVIRNIGFMEDDFKSIPQR